MAAAGPWTPAFVQNVIVAQRDNAQMFEWAMQVGVGTIGLQVATNAGIHFVAWTYDKVKDMWKPKVVDDELQSDLLALEWSPPRGHQKEQVGHQWAIIRPHNHNRQWHNTQLPLLQQQ